MRIITQTHDPVVPSIVTNTPVEIWQEIIDHSLSDLALFSHNPYYPGCRLHTALNDWSDTQRLRKREVKRGILRLVSRSWKELVDQRCKKYFEPLICEDEGQKLAHASTACRLELNPFCTSCGWKWECQCDKCHMCTVRMRYPGKRAITSELVGGPPLKTEILALPAWEMAHISPDIGSPGKHVPMPKLRSLTIRGTFDLAETPFVLFSNLVFLSLKLGRSTRPPTSTIDLLSLQALRVELLEGNDCNAIEGWSMPNISHLDLSLKSYIQNDTIFMYSFVAKHGANLISLRLSLVVGWIVLPDDMWSNVPRLIYFGSSTLSASPGSNFPPRDHPLQTLGILEGNQAMPLARSTITQTISHWNTLTTVADSHNWDGLPSAALEDDLAVGARPHAHALPHCWRCVVGLAVECMAANVRYEDCMGRSLQEFQAKSSRD